MNLGALRSAALRSDVLWRRGPWILLGIAAVAYYPRFLKSSDSMALYADAAQCLLNHALVQSCNPLFSYPPAFAFLMIPFVAMPPWLREIVWYAVTLGALTGSFKLSEVLAHSTLTRPLKPNERGWMRLLGVVLSAKFVLAVLENQAYDGLVLLFVLLGLLALVRARHCWGGASLAIAAALKATPLIFLPYLLLTRRFAAAAAFVVVFAVVSGLPDLLLPPSGSGTGHFAAWLTGVAGASLGIDPAAAKHVFWAEANLLNHSLHGAVLLVIDKTTHAATYRAVLYGVYAAYLSIIGGLLLLSPRRKAMIAIDGSVLLISMLMLSPMTAVRITSL